jgi:molybdopterin-guanine dinucleotide biosynthesis protein MobB
VCGYLSGDADVLLPVLRSGQECYTAAVYNRRALPFIESCLLEKDYCIYIALKGLRVKRISLAETVFPDSMLDNFNTPEEYSAFLRRSAGPAMIAVSGIKNSGKTTLLEKIIPRLSERGFRIAVIKHDGHDFKPDVEGTDTHRFLEAGAFGTGIFSGSKYMLVKTGGGADEAAIARHFSDMDILFLEGFKHSEYPKIEIVREAVSKTPVCAPETLIAMVTDLPLSLEAVPVCRPDDIGLLCDIIETHVRKRWENA